MPCRFVVAPPCVVPIAAVPVRDANLRDCALTTRRARPVGIVDAVTCPHPAAVRRRPLPVATRRQYESHRRRLSAREDVTERCVLYCANCGREVCSHKQAALSPTLRPRLLALTVCALDFCVTRVSLTSSRVALTLSMTVHLVTQWGRTVRGRRCQRRCCLP